MLSLYRFFIGFLRVAFLGELKERLLNLAARNKISLRNTRLTENGLEAEISVPDFRRLRSILRKSGIRVHILKKYGLPFKIAKNRSRYGWLVGPLIFIAILKILSGRIWIIDVSGNKTVSAEEITAVCEGLGLKEGINKASVNTYLQKQRLLLEMNSLAWAAINIEGCRLTVNVSEVNAQTESNDCICNLKASADGIIQKIDVTSGNCIVKIGDTVKKGDILVSGILEKPYGTQYVHSSGTVTAATERSITVSGEYKIETEYENGSSAKKRVIEFFSFKIPLYLGSEHKAGKAELSVKSLMLFGQRLPIKLYEKSFRYTEKRTVYLTDDELCQRLRKEISKQLEGENVTDFKILNESIKTTENGLCLTQTVSSVENIALRSEFSVIPDSDGNE